MRLREARALADRLLDRLEPHVARVVVAGSVRRGCPQVKDVELVVEPRDVSGDLFGRRRMPPEKRRRRLEQKRRWREENREYIERERRRRKNSGYANREDYLAYQRAYNEARRLEKLEYMKERYNVYGPENPPTCRGCGVEIDWNGRGRPKLDCPDCRS